MPLERSARKKLAYAFLCFMCACSGSGQQPGSTMNKGFRVLAFYTGQHDLAHISFIKEANLWFDSVAAKHHFQYESTTQWNRLQKDSLKDYQVLLFLDSRPEDSLQRINFEEYMKNGGAWMGFHFSAFALTPSRYPQDWNWYHNQFLGSGSYVSNTWRPTAVKLRVSSKDPITKDLPKVFRSAPNEWYRWENDLRKNKSIRILLSIDSTSFPVGTGPKPYEIWHSGFYPVAWRNLNYRMVYLNMGHNDMDYEGGTNATLSSTFSSPWQSKFIVSSLLWLGTSKR